MNILISSHAFAPSLGGIETVSRLLGREFAVRGHKVTVVTQTKGASEDRFEVVRGASIGELLPLVRECDIYWQNNLSLRTLWPVAFQRRPVVVTHQGSYAMRPTGFDGPLRLKRAIAHQFTGVAISEFVANSFHNGPVVIPNPYDAGCFRKESGEVARSGELLFVGRLVAEKGLDILFDALKGLDRRGLRPTLTVVGSGPILGEMQKLAADLGLSGQVNFVGPQSGDELSKTLNRHRILVVPSRYQEPFGVVALEGIACGCVVVGSRGGGLPEAIGACGLTFPNGDAEALANILERLLRSPGEADRLLKNAPEHLARFQPAVIADRYLELFKSKLA